MTLKQMKNRSRHSVGLGYWHSPLIVQRPGKVWSGRRPEWNCMSNFSEGQAVMTCARSSPWLYKNRLGGSCGWDTLFVSSPTEITSRAGSSLRSLTLKQFLCISSHEMEYLAFGISLRKPKISVPWSSAIRVPEPRNEVLCSYHVSMLSVLVTHMGECIGAKASALRSTLSFAQCC
jgi:hypothetical protein